MDELIEVSAETHFKIMLDCPHCNHYQDRQDDLTESLDPHSLSTDNCDVELECEKCGKSFIVKEVIY